MRLKRRQELAHEKIDDGESSKEVEPEKKMMNAILKMGKQKSYEHTDKILNRQGFIPDRRVRKTPKWLSEYETY
jgi:hypothetical protein